MERPSQLAHRVATSLKLRAGRGWVTFRRWAGGAERKGPPPAPGALDDVPIVVAGCHRSGTSLVRRILDSHPRIACPPETQFLEPLASVVTHPVAEAGLAALDVSLDQAAAELGAVADRWLRAYADRHGKRRWAEKSPNVVHQLPGVDHLFGHRARFLLVVRDGMDVAHSLGKGKWTVLDPFLARHPNPYLAAAHYWVDMNDKLLAFRDRLGDRGHLLRYDDLVGDPEGILRPVFAFLGEPWDPIVLDFNRSPHDGGVEDHYVTSTWTFEDNRGKHRRLAVDLQREMWDVVRPAMLRLGYPDRVYGPVGT